MSILIGIAGGSGSGKSTVAYGLQEQFPDLIEVVHFDDYHKKKEIVPVLHGMANWDHPDAIDFESALRDLTSLKEGREVTVMTKSPKYNPENKQKGRMPYVLKAKRVIIVEGYLVLADSRLRDLFEYKVFLDLDADERMRRRTKFVDPEYTKKILLPMHQKYVEPSKRYADDIIDVKGRTKQEVCENILSKLKENGII